MFERVVAAERQQVVAGHDRGEVAPAVEQLAAAAGAFRFGEHAAEHDQPGSSSTPAVRIASTNPWWRDHPV